MTLYLAAFSIYIEQFQTASDHHGSASRPCKMGHIKHVADHEQATGTSHVVMCLGVYLLGRVAGLVIPMRLLMLLFVFPIDLLFDLQAALCWSC